MSNRVANRLIVRGLRPDLAALRAELSSAERSLDFAAHLPVPPEIEARASAPAAAIDLGAGPEQLDPQWGPNRRELALAQGIWQPLDGHYWRLRHWGAGQPQYVRRHSRLDRGRLTYHFDTGDSPPLGWLMNVAPRFPELTFDLVYAEPLNRVAGRVTLRGERWLRDESWNGDEGLARLHARRLNLT